jgi:glycosyltransferase involved in cell wall biosynthesis
MSRPSVTVVIATHNRPELLRSAVRAVLAQDYPAAIDVVAVFDRSDPDRTLEQLAGGVEPARRVSAIANERTPGLAGARNSGIAQATGVLVGFCDDDDEWLPGKLTTQVDRMIAEGADTSVTGILVDYQGTVVPRVPAAEELTLAGLIRDRVFAAHPSTVLVRRTALLNEIGLVDEDIPGSYGEDYDWLLRAARHGRIAVVAEPLVRVMWGATSYFNRRFETIDAALGYLLAKHPEFESDRRGLARIHGQQAFASAASGHRRRALGLAARTVRSAPAERRAYLAALIALRLLRAETVLKLAHARGKGI